MIDPNNINTIRVGQLVEAVFSGTDNIPHEVGTDLRRGTIADLATYIAGVIDATGGLAFLPISVTDGQELPATTTNEWFLAGAGTYTQIGGFPDIVCTEKLSVIIGNGTNWSLGVSIPINIDPAEAMISQTVNLGVTNYSPSEDAVRKAIDDSVFLNAVGSFHYSNSQPFVAVTANVETKLLNDTLGAYTNVSNAPFGVSTLWNATTNQFDFSQLAIGDLVKLRPDLNINLVGTNTSYKLYMKMAIGSSIPWTLTLLNSERKSTDEFNDAHLMGFDIGNAETKDYPAEIYILTDAGADIKVNGWYLEVVRKNINIIDIAGEVPLATSLVTGTVKTDITEVDPIVYTKATVDDLLADKQNILTIDATPTDGSTNAVSSNGVFDALALKANADGTILYHSTKWFTPSSTVSNVGANVASVGTQFTSGMVGAKLIINGEQRIITAFTSSTVVTVDSAYSTNYSGVVAGSWGVYSKSFEVKTDNSVRFYAIESGILRSAYLDQYMGFYNEAVTILNMAQFNSTGGFFAGNKPIRWNNATNSLAGTADIGIRRNASGILEIYNGVTADGTLTNRRDILVRNLLASVILVNGASPNGVDSLLVNGTVSISPATLPNQAVTKAQMDLIRPYKVYSALISQSGTDAPTVIVLENSIGSIVWTRTSSGVYTGTLTGAFTVDKTMLFVTSTVTSGDVIYANSPNVNTVQIEISSDNLLTKSSIEIRVYN